MTDSDVRTKMITVRLSKTEYDILRAHYRTYGARSASELTRIALRRILDTSDVSEETLAAKVAVLNDRIQEQGERIHALESQISPLFQRDQLAS